eukprot:COSAG05_NODE_433_length_9859_cov_4.471004_1_plen_279_part_00
MFGAPLESSRHPSKISPPRHASPEADTFQRLYTSGTGKWRGKARREAATRAQSPQSPQNYRRAEANAGGWQGASGFRGGISPNRRRQSPPGDGLRRSPQHRQKQKRRSKSPARKPPRAHRSQGHHDTTDIRLGVPDEQQCDALFSQMDYNGNGGLSLAEIDKACVEIWPHFNHKKALMRAYKSADRSDDGYIMRRQFKELLHYIAYFTELWDKFESIDRDGDHRLSLEEFMMGSAAVGHPLSHPEARAEFAKMDDNGGGLVLFDEFCRWCVRDQPASS